MLLEVLDRSLRLLHPFMPFVTEEIWQKLGGVEPSIMIAPYPIAEEVLEDPRGGAADERGEGHHHHRAQLRAERGFTPKDRFKLYIRGSDARASANFFRDYAYLLIELARLDRGRRSKASRPPARIRTSWKASPSPSSSRRK